MRRNFSLKFGKLMLPTKGKKWVVLFTAVQGRERESGEEGGGKRGKETDRQNTRDRLAKDHRERQTQR